jgi:hypothetical protein
LDTPHQQKIKDPRRNDLEKGCDRINQLIRTDLRYIRRVDPKFASYLVPSKINYKKGVLIVDQYINFLMK